MLFFIFNDKSETNLFFTLMLSPQRPLFDTSP